MKPGKGRHAPRRTPCSNGPWVPAVSLINSHRNTSTERTPDSNGQFFIPWVENHLHKADIFIFLLMFSADQKARKNIKFSKKYFVYIGNTVTTKNSSKQHFSCIFRWKTKQTRISRSYPAPWLSLPWNRM